MNNNEKLEIKYKEILRVIRNNFNVRLQHKTNYGRNELLNIVEATLADSLADLLENNIPKTRNVLDKEVKQIFDQMVNNTEDNDLPW